MFNVTLRKKDMRFEFRHVTVPAPKAEIEAGQEPTKDLTYCLLYLDKTETEVPYAEVHVIRNYKDRPDKHEANKKALTKLLLNTDFGKEERALIWDSFFNVARKPKKSRELKEALAYIDLLQAQLALFEGEDNE